MNIKTQRHLSRLIFRYLRDRLKKKAGSLSDGVLHLKHMNFFFGVCYPLPIGNGV